MWMLFLMYLYIKALASCLAAWGRLKQLEPKGCAWAIGRGVVRFAVVGLLIVVTATIGTTTKTKADETVPATTLSDTLPEVQDIFSEPAPKTITFELVESEYDKKIKAEQEAAKARAIAAKAKAKPTVVTDPKTPSTANNTFFAGYCTWYVASRFPVTWNGNAVSWAANARAQGYRVDKNPEAGAILQTTENSFGTSGAGHVAYIEKVENGLIYTSEMNIAGRFVVSYRTIPVNSGLVLAVIHRR